MGMSTHVQGFKPPDEKWEKMRAVWLACEAAGVGFPEPVAKFFDGEPPDPAGVEVEESELRKSGAVTDWNDGRIGAEGFEVDVRKLPADVTVLRFYNSW
jgi:hypothetical protein